MKQIIIGKEGNQNFVIPDPNVSRKHAILQIDEGNGSMFLIDNQSTNGTYIYKNNAFVRLFANQAYSVTFDTMIQLGPNTRFHISKLFQQEKKPSQPQQPKKVDIRFLRKVSDQYVRDKMQIDSETSNIATLGTLSIVISAVSGVASNFLVGAIEIQDTKVGPIITIIIMIIGFSIVWKFRSIKTRKLSILKNKAEHDYAANYCCPVCHTSFKGKIYENILAERACPKCKTEFYEEPIKK